MPDDKLRDQVAKAVCSIAIGSERVETVMEIIQEHTAKAELRADARARADPRCGCTVLDDGGIEEPCNRKATGWRWYQNVEEHEDCLDPACDWHANEGGRRIHRAEAAIERVRSIAFDSDTISALERGVVESGPNQYDGLTKDEALGYAVDALRDIRAALDGSETS